MDYTVGTKVFGDWIIKKEIGSGSYGVVYEIEKNSYGVIAKSALKVIRIPASKADVKTALSEGMDEASLVNYFEGCVEEIVKEIAVMSGLKNHPNIVTYEDHHVEKKQDEFGWNILIRMELLTSLQDYQLSHKMTEEEIVQMAKDICNALVYCQERKIIHRDIKPENIFVNELGQFKLGDFGVARTVDKTMGGLSKKGTEGYMAPEVYLGKSYGASVDIYSLGLMMYRLLNRNRMPFLPQAPKPITFQDRESSLVRRMQGEALPQPLDGSEELKRVILKACAYNPEDRYRTAREMLDALEKCRKNEKIEETSIPLNLETEDEEEVKGTIGIWGDSNEKRTGEIKQKQNKNKKEVTTVIESEMDVDEEKEVTIGIWGKAKAEEQNREQIKEQENTKNISDGKREEKKGIGIKVFGIGGIIVVFILLCFIFMKASDEKKYEYVVTNYNNKDMKTYEYLVDLKDKGYDVEKLYDDLYQWRVTILTSDDENDLEKDEKYFESGENVHVTTYLEGGYPQEEIPLKFVIKYSDKCDVFEYGEWKDGFGDSLKVEIPPNYNGTMKFEIVHGESILGEKTIHVSDKSEQTKEIKYEEDILVSKVEDKTEKEGMSENIEEVEELIEKDGLAIIDAKMANEGIIYIDNVRYQLGKSKKQDFINNGWQVVSEQMDFTRMWENVAFAFESTLEGVDAETESHADYGVVLQKGELEICIGMENDTNNPIRKIVIDNIMNFTVPLRINDEEKYTIQKITLEEIKKGFQETWSGVDEESGKYCKYYTMDGDVRVELMTEEEQLYSIKLEAEYVGKNINNSK